MSYGNGRFVAVFSVSNEAAYGTFHDGVMWNNKKYVVSRDIDKNVSMEITSDANSVSVETSSMTITGINVRYYKVKSTTDFAFEFKKLRLPEMSRVVDFTTNPYSLINCSHIHQLALTSADKWQFDESYSCYTNASQYGYHLKMPFLNANTGQYLYGDYFSFVDLTQGGSILSFTTREPSSWQGSNSRWHREFFATGLYRNYIDFDSDGYGLNSNREKRYYVGDQYHGLHNDYTQIEIGSAHLMMIGSTLSVNTILYFGVGQDDQRNSIAGKYKWQYDGSTKTYALGPTQAVSNVTKDACAKLKTDWKDNLRIYIIKYRKQEKYKHPVTGSETAFDYTYLDECATDKTHVYDVSTEDDLKSTLQKIADDIKSSGFADYKPAKNVSASGN